jgi:hypothetical protein
LAVCDTKLDLRRVHLPGTLITDLPTVSVDRQAQLTIQVQPDGWQVHAYVRAQAPAAQQHRQQHSPQDQSEVVGPFPAALMRPRGHYFTELIVKNARSQADLKRFVSTLHSIKLIERVSTVSTALKAAAVLSLLRVIQQTIQQNIWRTAVLSGLLVAE